jgi:Uma2 family endonuclease
MNIAVRKLPMSLASFADWIDGQRERYELKDGQPVMMTHVSFNHAITTKRFLFAVERGLANAGLAAVASDFGVIIGEDMRFPDIVVLPAHTPGRALDTREPALVIEVLAPSSIQIDMREKADEYLSLPSLHAYVVASQDEPRVWVWRRGEDGVFPKKPDMIAGNDAMLDIASLGLSIRLGEVYAPLPPQPTLP